MVSATFVLSTGRCGTQWLTEKLSSMYPKWQIAHEPLSFHYRPDLNTELLALTYNRELIQQHLSDIQQHLNLNQSYVETGFPCWRHLQWFRQQLDGRVKVIHLHRNPVDTVHSLLKINAFIPPFVPHLPLKNLFLPSPDHGYLAEWYELWPLLNPAEKNLWYWTEVQAKALQLRQEWPANDWLEVSFEHLFSSATEQALAAFLGPEAVVDATAPGLVDQYGAGAIALSAVEFPLLQNVPAIKQMVERLGYNTDFCSNS